MTGVVTQKSRFLLKTSASDPSSCQKMSFMSLVTSKIANFVTQGLSWFMPANVSAEHTFSISLLSPNEGVFLDTTQGQVFLECRYVNGYTLSIVDEQGKERFFSAATKKELEDRALPYLETILQRTKAIDADYKAKVWEHSEEHYLQFIEELKDKSLLEELPGKFIFHDQGTERELSFEGPDRYERLKLYLRWSYRYHEEGHEVASFGGKVLQGVIGTTLLASSVIAPALAVLQQLKIFERVHSVVKDNLSCSVGVVASGLCSISSAHKEPCIALPLLGCMGQAQAELIVVNPIPDMTIPYDTLYTQSISSMFYSTAGITNVSVTTSSGASLPPWLRSEKLPNGIVGSYPPKRGAFDSQSIAVSGNYTYSTNPMASTLEIIDVSDPEKPAFKGSMEIGEITDVIAFDHYVCVEIGLKLEIFDIADPTSPSLKGSLDHSNYYNYYLAFSNGYIYSTGSSSTGLTIIDVSDPANPTLKSTFKNVDNGFFRPSVTYDYAYLPTMYNGLQIVDVSDPANPTLKGTFAGSYYAASATSNYVYLGGFSDNSDFRIIDISDPANPTLKGRLNGVYVNSITISGNYAYILDNANRISIIDISNPATPTLKTSIQMIQPRVVVISGSYAYIGDAEIGLEIFDVSNPESPTLKGYSHNSLFSRVTVANNYAYIIDQYEGLIVVDVVNPVAPKFVSSLIFEPLFTCRFNGIAFSNNYVFLCLWSDIFVVDVHDPINPTLKGSTNYGCDEIVIKGSYAYAANSGSLKIFNVSNPANITLIGSINTPSQIEYISVIGNYAYTSGSQFLIFDVSSPTAPTLKASLNVGSSTTDIAVVGNYAYTLPVGSPKGLRVIDISDPANPTLKGFVSIDYGEATSLVVANNYAYVVGDSGHRNLSGLDIIDISNPSNPSLFQTVDLGGGYVLGVDFSSGYAYVACYENGLKIVGSNYYQLTGTPPFSEHGKKYGIKIRVENALHEVIEDTFTLSVFNKGPSFNLPIPDKMIRLGQTLELTLAKGTFSDSQGDPLTYSAYLMGGAPLPDWLHFEGSLQHFSGKANSRDDIATLPIRIMAKDPFDAVAVGPFSLEVYDIPPVLNNPISTQNLHIGNMWLFNLPRNTFSDVNNYLLHYLAELATGDALPSWLSIDSLSGRFSGRPTRIDEIGVLPIELTAANAFGTNTSTAFNLNVYNRGVLVSNSIPSKLLNTGMLFDYTIPFGLFVDQDGDPLTYHSFLTNSSPLPSWLHFNGTARKFLGTPGANDDGYLQVHVVAQDPYGADAATDFEMTIYKSSNNDVKVPEVNVGIADKTIDINEFFRFVVPANAFKLPNGKMTYTAIKKGGGKLPGWLYFDETAQTFMGTPKYAGSVSVVVVVEDAKGHQAQNSFNIDIVNVDLQRAELVARFVGPIFSVLSIALSSYLMRGRIRNLFNCYQKKTATINVGDSYKYDITTLPAGRVDHIICERKMKKPKRKFFIGWKVFFEELPNRQLMPKWLKYDERDNTLQVIPAKMDNRNAGIYRIQIVSKDHGVREQVILTIQANSAYGQTQSSTSGSQGGTAPSAQAVTATSPTASTPAISSTTTGSAPGATSPTNGSQAGGADRTAASQTITAAQAAATLSGGATAVQVDEALVLVPPPSGELTELPPKENADDAGLRTPLLGETDT